MQLSKLKMFLYFRKWNFLAPSLTNSYIFSNFLFCISTVRAQKIEKNTLKKVLIFSYILGNGTF